MVETFKIGLITKPQGVKGELKVQPLTDDVSRFKNLKEVIVDGEIYRITRTKIAGDTAFVSLDGIDNRNTAETFRGKFLLVKREDAISLKKDEFFIADLIGMKVICNAEIIGEIVEITENKTDIVVVKTVSGKTMRFPFLKDVLIKVDLVKNEMEVDIKRLGEICVYED